MKDKGLETFLQRSLREKAQPERLEETVKLCVEIVRGQRGAAEEARTGFFRYLSDVFRFEGIAIFGLQAFTLFFVCLAIYALADITESINVFIPLFVLAVVPVIFKSQYFGMSEMEAATRASGAQIILAKLVLAGAANLVCMTILLCLEVHLQGSGRDIGRMVLYCLVPYFVCMVLMLRLVRLGKKDGAPACIFIMLAFCAGWGISARVAPWLYETSAMGVWVIAFWIFTVFFIKEIYFILAMRKEGRMYGIVA